MYIYIYIYWYVQQAGETHTKHAIKLWAYEEHTMTIYIYKYIYIQVYGC
jgi:hypothetical protein